MTRPELAPTARLRLVPGALVGWVPAESCTRDGAAAGRESSLPGWALLHPHITFGSSDALPVPECVRGIVKSVSALQPVLRSEVDPRGGALAFMFPTSDTRVRRPAAATTSATDTDTTAFHHMAVPAHIESILRALVAGSLAGKVFTPEGVVATARSLTEQPPSNTLGSLEDVSRWLEAAVAAGVVERL